MAAVGFIVSIGSCNCWAKFNFISPPISCFSLIAVNFKIFAAVKRKAAVIIIGFVKIVIDFVEIFGDFIIIISFMQLYFRSFNCLNTNFK
jgi:hypothetical protein